MCPTVKVYFFAAGRTLDVLLDPAAEAHDVEDVTTWKLFADSHLIEADDAGGVSTGIGLLLTLRRVTGETHGW